MPGVLIYKLLSKGGQDVTEIVDKLGVIQGIFDLCD